MFKFLKEKLKDAVSIFSKKVEEEAKEIIEEKPIEVKKEEVKEKKEKKIERVEEEKKGFFTKIKEKVSTTHINESKFNELFWDLEVTLLENNVAVEVIDKIKNDLKNELVEKPIKRGKIEEIILESLRSSINELFDFKKFDLIKEIKEKKEKPYVIVFFGVNGSGKTTTIAKLAYLLKQNKLNCVMGAADTFRAAAIDQLEEHASRLGIGLIKHSYGSDPAAVAFDAVKHAKSKNIDVVLIDTAGRQHSNINLMKQMEKIVRVVKPDLKIFIGESIVGNDAVNQAQQFNSSVGIDGIILTKADVDEKGGAAISVGYVTKKPILYLGNGQKYNELEEFDKEKIIKNIGL